MLNKTTNTKKKGINPVTAGLVGTGIGVAVGTAAVVLSKKKNRTKVINTAERVRKKLLVVKNQGEDIARRIQKKSRKLKNKYSLRKHR